MGIGEWIALAGVLCTVLGAVSVAVLKFGRTLGRVETTIEQHGDDITANHKAVCREFGNVRHAMDSGFADTQRAINGHTNECDSDRAEQAKRTEAIEAQLNQ